MSDPVPPRPSFSSAPRLTLAWFFAWLLLTIYFVRPPDQVFDHTLDPSNYATYAYFITHDFQWGVNVMPMPGPLGFVLFGYCYSGELYLTRLVIDVLLCGTFSLLLLRFVRLAQAGALRWVWFAVMIVAIPMIDDLMLDATVLLATVTLLRAAPGRLDRWSLLATALLACIALIKGTHLMMCGVVFGAIALLGLIERRPARVVPPFVAFAATFLLFWMLTGQSVRNLPEHVEAVRHLASGYNATMGLEPFPVLEALGLVVLAALSGLLLSVMAVSWRTPATAVSLLFLSALAFLKWKHGYVRADGHVYIFFTAAAVIGLTAWLIGFTPVTGRPTAAKPARWFALAGLALATFVVTAGLIGASEFSLQRIPRMVAQVPARLLQRVIYLVQPGRLQAQLEERLERNRIDADLPQIRNEVGDDPIDFFGNEEGVLLLNRMDYRPKPMGGGTFNVVDRWLLRHNEAYTLDPRTAPPWQLLKLLPFDDRLPAADDGLALRAVLDCYSPVIMQRDYLLLERVRDRSESALPQPLGTQPVRLGEPLQVPTVQTDQVLLFALQAPHDLYGRWRTFAYRAPLLTGKIVSTRYPLGRTFVLKPALLQDPVILSPLLEETVDVLKLYGNVPGDSVKSITIDAAPGFDTSRLAISFFVAPRPPPPTDTDIQEILTYVKHPLHNREPVNLVTGDTGIKELNKEPVTLVHAPGSITWSLQPGDQQVIFSYGLMPQAYLNGGSTDGVEFHVEVLWPPNDGRVLYSHTLRPVGVPEHRGMHRTRVMLPPYEAGAQLRIRTHPGQDNDGAYDQSYITRLQIKQGPVIAEQFNGLGVVPANERLPHTSVAGIESRPVYLIHAPDEVALNIPASARTFHAEIGLLPGAYTNGGNSDGVEFTVLVEEPGSPARPIWSRLLNPRQQSEDRGSIPVSVPLPVTAPGARLVLKTGVGPNGDRGWDQSYVEKARFE